MPLSFAINPAVAALDAPPIPTAQGWKAAYDGRLGPMIDLSQAVPGTPPPEEFLARLAQAAGSADAARYGPILGDAALREAHAVETARLYGGSVTALNVAITSGCNQAFVVTMLALARAGDAVMLPAPWYFNHRMTLDMLGIETRVLPCHGADGFVPDPDLAERLIDARTRALVLVSPNNPTGAVYPPGVIERFASLARRRRIALVLDETYRDFLPPEQTRAHALFDDSRWGQTLVQLYSFSKSYAIPGHRLGAIVASPAFIGEVAKILDSLQICPARPAQRVVAWAIEAMRPWREAQRTELASRAQACREALANGNRWRIGSIGAYFAMLEHPFEDAPSAVIAEQLASLAGVLGLPGSYFGPGQERFLRFAFANIGSAGLAPLGARLKALDTLLS